MSDSVASHLEAKLEAAGAEVRTLMPRIADIAIVIKSNATGERDYALLCHELLGISVVLARLAARLAMMLHDQASLGERKN